MRTLGERLRAVRAERGLKLREVAKGSGLSPSAISDLEHGRQLATTKVPELAAALGVRPEWLQRGEGPRTGDTPSAMVMLNHRLPMSPEAARVAHEWDKLAAHDSAAAEKLAELIYLLVASHRRSKARGKSVAATTRPQA